MRREAGCTGRNFILSDVVLSPKEERSNEKKKVQAGAAILGRGRLEAEGTPRVVEFVGGGQADIAIMRNAATTMLVMRVGDGSGDTFRWIRA